jgi:hypothetical protein
LPPNAYLWSADNEEGRKVQKYLLGDITITEPPEFNNHIDESLDFKWQGGLHYRFTGSGTASWVMGQPQFLLPLFVMQVDEDRHLRKQGGISILVVIETLRVTVDMEEGMGIY